MGTPGFSAHKALSRGPAGLRADSGRDGSPPASARSRWSEPSTRPRLVPQQFDDMALSYGCDSATNECKCKGVLDCDNMRGSGDCQGGVEVCKSWGCTCQWH